jgi:hypothetical protein
MDPPESRQVREVITMFSKVASVVVGMALMAGGTPALGDTPDPATGKIVGYTYGEDAYNSYTAWSGGMLWIWQFSSQHIGVAPGPSAETPFYLHIHTAVIAPDSVTGNVLLTLDQDAGGLPLSIATGIPLVYELDDDLKVVKHYYLGDPEEIAKATAAVVNQGINPR